jgi:hypothetical protein
VDGPELCGETTAVALVLRMRCVGVRCHTVRSHHATVYLFVTLKNHLAGRQLHNNKEMEMAVCERLRMQNPSFFCNRILKLAPRRDKCIGVLGD